MSDDPASSAAAAAAAAVVAAANPLPDLATMLTEPLRKPQVPLPLPLNPVDDMEASSIQALARLRDSPQRPIAPPSPNRTPRRGARGLFQAAGAGAGGAGGGAGSAPGTPAGGSRRRRTRTQPSKGAHIMTFFEKDINLAAITEVRGEGEAEGE